MALSLRSISAGVKLCRCLCNLSGKNRYVNLTKYNALRLENPSLNFKRNLSQTATFTKKRNGWMGKVAAAAGIGLAIGCGIEVYELYAAPSRQRYEQAVEVDGASDVKKTSANLPPKNLKVTRVVDGPLDDLGLELLLFQYQSCPFCCKVRAFLEYFGIPYSLVEVNPVMRTEIKFSKYRKVPILMVKDATGDYHQLNDSSAIVSILGTFLLDPQRSLDQLLSLYQSITYTDENTGKEVTQVMNRYHILYEGKSISAAELEKLNEERKWRVWVDDHLVHQISPNIYRSREEAVETFNQFSVNGHWEDTFSLFQRKFIIFVGATAMYFIGRKLKNKYHLKEDVRESLYDSINDWMSAMGVRDFMGGNQPNLADLAVYGVLNSFEGCRAFNDMVQETDVGPWYMAVKEQIAEHSASALVPEHKK